MALFGKLFDKKECSVCGGEIGLLGNRKLEDGNLCKNCAAKLSPWFSERRSSTVEEIKEQLAYREENRLALDNFHVTRSIGRDMKVQIDEDAGKFVVTRAKNLKEGNPDIIDFINVTGVDLDISENTREEKRKDAEGKMVSYNPPRYFYSYNFRISIHVNHPYFDVISYNLNSSSVEVNRNAAVPAMRKPDQTLDVNYMEYENMAKDIQKTLTSGRTQARKEVIDANTPKMAVTCPWCGATTIPDANGCCEYCGGSLKDVK